MSDSYAEGEVPRGLWLSEITLSLITLRLQRFAERIVQLYQRICRCRQRNLSGHEPRVPLPARRRPWSQWGVHLLRRHLGNTPAQALELVL
jgi:hypothetical protein